MPVPLFLYGTLLHAPLRRILAGPGEEVLVPAVLPDHRVEQAAGSPRPMLVAAPGAVARGAIVTGLTESQRARLDAYEALFGHALRPVAVIVPDGRTVAAETHVPPPALASSGAPWDLAAWERDAGAAALAAAEEIASLRPPPDPAALLRQWPMIRSRACARARAAATLAPARLRRDPRPGDFGWREVAPPAGEFFRFAALEMWHRRFDGGIHAGLRREVLVGVDAALVLPYDARRDRVLLVEQFRAGVARRGDPNPWTLEPVAGIVDADETPEEAALRETAEEARLTGIALERMFGIYASPGSTTDHFHCYLGHADLPDGHADRGGLHAEQEDLRLHLVDFDAAMALIDSGEVTVGPLAAMLLWLARARGRLRRAAGAPA